MEIILSEIFKAVRYLFIAGIVYFAYKTAHDNSIKSGYKSVLWKGFLWIVMIAFFTSITLGNPSCESGPDPLYGGCEYYADDGFEPTTEQRLANFLYFMTLLYVPVVFGAFDGRKKIKKKL